MRLYQDFSRITGADELVSHEFVEEHNGPFRTQFSGGAETLVNTTNEMREVDGEALPPESILSKFPDGKKRLASVERNWIIKES